MKIYRYILVCLIGILLSPISCVMPFEPSGVKDTAGILVVEGMILETGTTIKLGRTVELYGTPKKESASGLAAVNNARVHVIDDKNHTVAVAILQNIDGSKSSIYVVQDTITFIPGTKYALSIQIGEKQYQSAFVAPVRTPEIDEINWRYNEGESMDIMVSTHDPDNETKYYRWEFEEDWEIRSKHFSTLRYELGTGKIIEQNLFSSNNRYYCWASDKSKSILLGATARLTETTIKNKIIHNFPVRSSRFSYLYSILVKQYGLDKNTYTYFENLQKNIEQNGSIFAPQPTELRGNIKCISHDERNIHKLYQQYTGTIR